MKRAPDKSCPHLAPYTVITMLLTILPALCFISHDCFVTADLYFLVLSPFSASPPTLFLRKEANWNKDKAKKGNTEREAKRREGENC